MHRSLLLLLLALVVALGAVPASADATLVAQGTVTVTTKAAGVTRTCSAVSGVAFHNTGSTFLLMEVTPGGQAQGNPPACVPVGAGPYLNAPTIQQCTPVGGVVMPGSTLTVSGSTYTIKSPYTTCGGTHGTDTIVMTVSAASVVYKHDLNDGEGSEIRVAGTLTRAV
jgi:hypothetical protein